MSLTGATFVPFLAEQLKVGVSKSHQSSQTQTTDLIDIEHLKKVIAGLKLDLSSVRRELKFSKQVMQANFEQVSFYLLNYKRLDC